MRFSDKVAVVTGAGSGIGRMTALGLAAEGASVVVADLAEAAAIRVATEIADANGQALGLACDVSDVAMVEATVDAALARFGRIDVLVNNAGCGTDCAAEDYSLWERMIAVNLSGAFYFSRAVAKRAMIPARSGAIVNVASLAGLVGNPRDVGYVAAKHGVVGLTKALAVEWAQHGLRVNCICPGITETPIFAEIERIAPGKFDERRKRVPIGRSAQPHEQAKAILFLASSDASSITGVSLPVDGGQMALSSGWLPPAVSDPVPAPPAGFGPE